MRRGSLILLLVLVVAAAGVWLMVEEVSRASVAPDGSAEAAELEPFEQRVRDYLLRNPEVIMEALQILQERQRAVEAESLKRAIAERSGELLNDPAAPVGGNAAGDVTLVEFFDYNCPYCRRVAPTVAEIVGADPGLRVVYKEFPILGPGSTFAARAALAVGRAPDPGDRAFDWSRPRAAARGHARSGDRPAIERNLQLAAALGITGTPSFVIGDEIVPGAVDRGTLEDLIAHVRQTSDAQARGRATERRP